MCVSFDWVLLWSEHAWHSSNMYLWLINCNQRETCRHRQIAFVLGENIAFLMSHICKGNKSPKHHPLSSVCWKIYIQGLNDGKNSNMSYPRAPGRFPSPWVHEAIQCREDIHVSATGDNSWWVHCCPWTAQTQCSHGVSKSPTTAISASRATLCNQSTLFPKNLSTWKAKAKLQRKGTKGRRLRGWA